MIARLGKPEWTLELHRQRITDYSEKGVRFTFNESDVTTGIAYFPHGRRRVAEGERAFMSLRGLRQQIATADIAKKKQP